MRKLFPILMLIILLVSQIFAAEVYNTPGPHTFWNGDTLKKNTTLTATNFLYMADFATLNVWLKTTNPVDSIKYRVFYKMAFSMSDTFTILKDSTGADAGVSTIMRIADTSWHFRSIDVTAPYIKLFLTSDATNHGNRNRVWLKAFLTK